MLPTIPCGNRGATVAPTPAGYPAYTDLGGYPIVYCSCDGLDLCARCASYTGSDDPVVGAYIYYEGPPLTCEDCGATIHSAYGVADED